MDDVRELYAYNEWANARVLDAAGRLAPEDFARHVTSSFPSVRATLLHMLQAEWIWLERWQGRSPPAAPESWKGMDLDGIRTAWRGVTEARERYFGTLDDAGLDRVFAYTRLSGERQSCVLRHALLHIVNHASYHRGQITTLLRQLGATAVPTDLVLFHNPSRP